ncbi:MAG: hypothetical protein H7333_07605 [Bdellovibrionales bacterium]|nr:hypothetical protein [Oligoflexia bacterium]
MKSNEYENPTRNNPNQGSPGGPLETGVKIDGLQQVIELLKHADPSFRESLLKRLTSRDPKLAQSLRKIIR